MTTEAQSNALQAALDQIDMAFGSKPQTPEFRTRRAQRRLDQLVPIRERMAALAAAEAAKDPNDQGWAQIDPLAAFIVAWYLRKEADSDNVISESGEASDALEEAADHIEDGEVLADPEQMLRELDETIDELRAVVAENSPDRHS